MDDKNDCLCKINGKVYDLHKVKEIINSYKGDINSECRSDIEGYLLEYPEIEYPDAYAFVEALIFNDNKIPEDLKETLEALGKHNKILFGNLPDCPSCGSSSVVKISYWDKSWWNGKLSKTFECHYCGYTW